jgi:RHH-type proline utilization regulon transcriptional repressor/proline dehydrogenase/delta 1-pyrroline-5-carboxylate dehydrogenase
MVIGQDNVLVYRPAGPLLVVAGPGSSALDTLSVLAGGLASGSDVHLSSSAAGVGAIASRDLVLLGQAARFPVCVEEPSDASARLEHGGVGFERVRWLGGSQPPDGLLRNAAALGCHVSVRPVLARGRYELLFHHREQSISIDYHRYGHLGFRSEGLGEVEGPDVLHAAG